MDFLLFTSRGPGATGFHCSGLDILEGLIRGGGFAARLGHGVPMHLLVPLGGEERTGISGHIQGHRSAEGSLLLSSP